MIAMSVREQLMEKGYDYSVHYSSMLGWSFLV
jgi:hypothetical protein